MKYTFKRLPIAALSMAALLFSFSQSAQAETVSGSSLHSTSTCGDILIKYTFLLDDTTEEIDYVKFQAFKTLSSGWQQLLHTNEFWTGAHSRMFLTHTYIQALTRQELKYAVSEGVYWCN